MIFIFQFVKDLLIQKRNPYETLEKALNGVEAEWTAYPYSVGDGARGTMRQSSFAYYKDVTCGAASLGDKVVVRQCDKPRWVSSNPAAVKVSADGTVKALKKGFSCVHLTCGGQRYYFYVSVHSAFQEKIWALQEKYPDGDLDYSVIIWYNI